MDFSVKPQWRVNLRPRFTVLELGEYMAADDGPRETTLRNMKYERLSRSLIYRILRPSIERFLTSPTRDRGILAQCRVDLERMRDGATGQKKENFNYELRALEAFEKSINAIGIGGINFERAFPASPLKIEGVSVSVQPTAHIRIVRPRGCDLVGAIIVDIAKGDIPKTEDRAARITGGMMHAAALIHQYVSNTFHGQDVKASQPHCVIFNSHRQERVCAPDNYGRMLRNVEAVCRNIARSWDGILPPSSFDPSLAMTRN
jgi:hypothetical protein